MYIHPENNLVCRKYNNSSYGQCTDNKRCEVYPPQYKHKEHFHMKRQDTRTLKRYSKPEEIKLFSILCGLAYEKLSNQQPKIVFANLSNIMVFLQCVFVCAWSGDVTGYFFSTFPTKKRFFSSMCAHVIGKDIGLGKSLSAHLATISFFSSVCSHVRGQAGGLGNYYSTLLATKVFFSIVRSHVHGQVVGMGKSFSTLLATKRFFPVCFCMCLVRLLRSENLF